MRTTHAIAMAALLVTTALAILPEAGAVSTACPVPADCRASPMLLSDGRPVRFTMNTTGATVEPGEPTGCGTMFHTVWARFKATQDGTAHVTQVANAPFTPTIGVYRQSGSSLVAPACDTGHNAQFADIAISCVAGAFYYIQVGTIHNASFGAVTLELDGCGPNGVGPELRGDYVGASYTHEQDAGACPPSVRCEALRVKSSGRVLVDTDPRTNPEQRTVVVRDEVIVQRGATTMGTGERGFVIVVTPPPPPGPGPSGLPDPSSFVASVASWARSGPVEVR